MLESTQGANHKIQELETARKDLLNSTSNLDDSLSGNKVAIDDAMCSIN